ncbi:MAG: sulfur carrier protein ThiS [Alphaproteobacteria bacterium]|nr:sulfur carrier protein ThiS [Alphaproteobacteria bacterium]
MKVIINGEEKTFEAPLNLYGILEQQGYVEMLIAVARNGSFVPKEQYQSINLESGDTLEILAPMQGG